MKKSESKKSLKALLTLILALTMAFVLVLSVSCGDDSSDSESTSSSDTDTSTEETATDSQTIANGDFEFYTTSSTTYPYSSSIKWTRSTDKGVVSAATSTAASGIIDTTDEAFNKLSDANRPQENPGTPIAEDNADTEANEGGKKILMIHNKVSEEGKGTAQYFTSGQSITLSYNQFAKISVWVKTAELKSAYAKGDMKDYGAYIKIRNYLNSETKPLLIKNINTNGEWVNYVIYLEPSTFAETRYQVVLGLGMGDSANVAELCEGFAFFDNVEYSVVDSYDVEADKEFSLYNESNVSYLDKDSEIYNPYVFTQSETGKDYTENKTVIYKMSFKKAEESALSEGAWNVNAVNPDDAEHKVAEYVIGENVGLTGESEKVITVAGGKEITVPANSIYMNFNGEGSSYTYAFDIFSAEKQKPVKATSYYKLSVSVKAEANGNSKNAFVALSDNGNDTLPDAFSNISTDEYARYTFYLINKYKDEIETSVSLKLSFGPTELTADSSYWDLPVGYAIFKDITLIELTEAEYKLVDTEEDTKAAIVVLKGKNANEYKEENAIEGDEYEEIKESYAFSIMNSNYNKIKSAPLKLSDTSANKYKTKGEGTVGLINSHYADNYDLSEEAAKALSDLEKAEAASTKHVQPIMIYNKDEAATGIIGETKTVSVNASYTFTVKLKVAGGATAYVYLVDRGIEASAFGNNNSIAANYPVYTFKTAREGFKNYYEELNEKFYAKVDGETNAGTDGYVTVTFYVTAGDEALDLRVEIWNGSRDGETLSKGYVFVGNVELTPSGYSSYEALEQDGVYSAEFFKNATVKKYNQGKVYSYYEGDLDDPAKYDDGTQVYSVADDYIVYAESKDGTVKYMRANVLGKITSVAKEEESESDSSSEEESASDEDETTVGNLVWLQIASIIIAAVLVAVLVIIILRKVFEKRSKKKERTRSYYAGYDKNTRRLPKGDVEA
ncbi:MAG: hypothetical protein J5836_02565, partial [Clostridia bacterium]|nr:hypothetical protein [Clostridia bacterium]